MEELRPRTTGGSRRRHLCTITGSHSYISIVAQRTEAGRQARREQRMGCRAMLVRKTEQSRAGFTASGGRLQQRCQSRSSRSRGRKAARCMQRQRQRLSLGMLGGQRRGALQRLIVEAGGWIKRVGIGGCRTMGLNLALEASNNSQIVFRLKGSGKKN